jgi:hypothetical protein
MRGPDTTDDPPGAPDGPDHLAGPDRRAVLVAIAGLASLAAGPAGAAVGRWPLAVQILAGTGMRDGTLLTLALEALTRDAGADVVARLHRAVLARDADDIGRPFEDPAVEAAARMLVEMLYTGEIADAKGSVTAVGFHQALAWEVLAFTKAPSVCGPGFGWWADPPGEA